MLRHVAGRLAQAVVASFGVLTIVFFVMRLSGDPTLLLVPEGATAEQIQQLRHALGFDRPLLVQYGAYIADLLRLDLGELLVQRAPVAGIVGERIPYTMALAAGALLVALGVGIPAGIIMAVRRGGIVERMLAAFVLAGQSLPTFWSGILLILCFGVYLHWLPTSGVDGVELLVMPSVALGALTMSTFARMTRISVLDELSRDYVAAARARGLSVRAAVFRHVLRNAAIPVVTIAALEVGNLLAGAVIVETVFAWPGIGQLAIQSIQARDFLVVQTIVLFVSSIYIGMSLVADFAYAVIDPRIRMGVMRGVSPGMAVILLLLVGFVVAALAAPWLAPFDPLRQSLLLRLRGPGTVLATGTFLLGTDDLGRDLLSRVLFGARASLMVAALSVSVSLLVGTVLGLLAGWFRGWTAIVIMRAVDTMLSIPAILLAVLTVAVLGPGFINLILVLGLTRWPRYTRVAYAQTLQVATLPYIRAAEMAGAGAARILWRHVLPNIAGPLMVVATSEFGLMILFEAGLSFLGLGIQPPYPSWGSIMSVGRQYVERAWWLTVFPGACLFVLVLSVNVFGDWLRDRVDPRSQGR